jgi:hypothetical protein
MNIDYIPQVNTGFKEGSGTKQLWLGGSIPYEVKLESGDWRPFVPVGEKQRPNTVDVMACVTFSDMNSLETQNIQQTGKELNFSDRFIAKLSGTTHDGNYLDKVADTVRNLGVVMESDYAAPANFTWDSYYSEVPQDVLKKALKVNMAYEFCTGTADVLSYHLKQAPIQIVITKASPNHAVLLLAIKGSTAYYFDSYYPYIKSIDVSNVYNSALKIVLKGIQPMSNTEFVHKVGTGEFGFYVPATSEESVKDKALNYGRSDIFRADGTVDFTKAKEMTL